MALIPQVKCTRCDRKYSGLRTRCPYCGARRRKQGSRSVTSDNSLWKLIVGLLLLVVLIAAVVVLIVTSVSENKNNDKTTDTKKETEVTSNEGVTSLEGTGAETTPNTAVEPGTTGGETEPGTTTVNDPASTGTGTTTNPTETTPTAAVTNVTITYNGRKFSSSLWNSELGMYEFTLKLTESITLGCSIEPSDSTATPVWSADDESILAVMQNGKVTGLKSGNTILRVTVDGVTDEVYVRVNSRG